MAMMMTGGCRLCTAWHRQSHPATHPPFTSGLGRSDRTTRMRPTPSTPTDSLTCRSDYFVAVGGSLVRCSTAKASLCSRLGVGQGPFSPPSSDSSM
eukprot:1751685-Rhodomonas_salina.1